LFEANRGLTYQEAASSIDQQRRDSSGSLRRQKELDRRWPHRRISFSGEGDRRSDLKGFDVDAIICKTGRFRILTRDIRFSTGYTIESNKGEEFTAKGAPSWMAHMSAQIVCIEPGRPCENG
jgi:hypothetical protein